jgi:exodeoxyribonuclease VII large subunit
VMWKSNFGKVKFEPEDGLAVLATGFVDVYTPQGKYQFYVDKLEPAGVGALQLAFEQMVRRLEAQALFDEAHKKPLPTYPERIGIFTSESGAAIHDITDSIHNRWPCARLFLYPVPVQGEGAADKIAAALRDVNRRNKKLRLDVLIVGRGGGSPEDLWAFNEEVLARAIFDSKIPVISAVGHEVDTTIADLVADARASTPTKAGVTAVPDRHEVLEQLTHFAERLGSRAMWKLQLCQKNLELLWASAVFRNPLFPVRNAEQRLDELQIKLADSMKELLVEAWARLHASYERVIKIEPHRILGKQIVHLNNLKNRAGGAIKAVINSCRVQLTAQTNRLAPLDPRSVLQRGYSITSNKRTGLLVRNLEDVRIADVLITELANENFIESKVTKR